MRIAAMTGIDEHVSILAGKMYSDKPQDGVIEAIVSQKAFVKANLLLDEKLEFRDEKSSDDSWLENIAISEAMKHLGAREKHIVNLRFFQGRTQMEVAEEIGISQAQVSRLEKSALKQMRKYI